MVQYSPMQKPSLVAIFAHPDDEAFGPAGTLALYTKTHDVYILCVTCGEAGTNSDNPHSEKTLSEIRDHEVHDSAAVLGIKEVRMLEFPDGGLNNNLYHKIADKVINHLIALKPEIVITFEPRGISGHIDHIVVSMVTSYIFERTSYIRELHYYCISEDEQKTLQDYFVYVPPGYSHEEIDKVVDVSSVWDLKVNAIKKHVSQSKDGDRMLQYLANCPKEELFIVKKK